MRPLRLLLLAPLLLLTACGDLFAPSYARLSADTIPMHALLTADVEVEARGSWTIETNASWLQASPASGSGDRTVTLTAAANTLTPGEYSTQIRIDGGDEPDYATVRFSFPRLRGNITVGGTTATSSPNFSQLSTRSGPGTLLVGLRDHEQPGFTPMSAFRVQSIASQVATLTSGLRLAEVYENLAIAAIEVDDLASAAAALSADPRVRYASPETMLEPLAVNDTYYQAGYQWSLGTIGVEDAWQDSAGAGVRVAVIDVGFYPGHTDLSSNVADTFDFVADQQALVERPACETHGTHVAGIVAAEADNNQGIAGIAHTAELVLLNVGDDTSVSSECRIPSSLVVDAFDWLLENPGSPKADIVNLSLGGPWDGAVLNAVRAAYREGVTVIAATGNDELADVLYPAAFPEVLAVSATDINDAMASYSTTGPEVFLSAPGGDTGDLILSTIYDFDTNSEGYAYMAGTSMASPAVAAAAALLKSYDPSFTPVAIAGILADSSKELGDTGRDDIFGYGRLDAGAALSLAQSTEPKGFLLRLDGSDYPVPAQQTFDLGYVDIGELEIEVSSNDTWNTDLQESGEYYGSRTVDTTGEPELEVTISVDQQ